MTALLPPPWWRQPTAALGALAVAMLAIGLLVVAATPDLHFVEDDWEFWLQPAVSDLKSSLIAAVYRRYRLGQEIYNALLIHTFGLDRMWFHIASVVLHAVTCAAFGLVVLRAWPGLPRLGIAAAAAAFAMPPLATLTWVSHLDAIRLSMLLVWVSVLLFQASQARRPLPMFAGALVFTAAFSVYEAGALFILALPAFLMPWLEGEHRRRRWLNVVTAIAVTIALMVAYRYLGGFIDKRADGNVAALFDIRHLRLLTEGLRTLIEPLRLLAPDTVAVAIGVIAALATVAAVTLVPAGNDRRRLALAAATGMAMFVLGVLPYWLGDFPAAVAWNRDARFLTSAGFGLALLIALAGTVGGRAALAARITLALLLGGYVAFWAQQRHDWAKAADDHCRMWTSLLQRAPALAPETNLLFLDLRWQNGQIPVFGGSDSLMALVHLLYSTNTSRVRAYHLERADVSGDALSAGPDGISTRLSLYHRGGRPMPADSLVIVARRGDRLDVLDHLTPADSAYNIRWNGITEIHTNWARIQDVPQGQLLVPKTFSLLSVTCAPPPESARHNRRTE